MASPPGDALRSLLAQTGKESRETLHRDLFRELRALAQREMRRLSPGQTLQPTALVHEAWLRLAGRDAGPWKTRREFLAVAGRAMHDVLVEQARRKASLRRGGAWGRLDLADLSLPTEATPQALLALDEALERLAASEPRKAELVRLRFFVGLSEEETAEALEISVRTVRRDWRFVRAWMYEALDDAPQGFFENGADDREAST